jgi:hypothetical protein
MLMRHFGHGIGHLKYERQQEAYLKRVPEGNDDHTGDDTSLIETKDNAEEPLSESEGNPVVDEDITGSSDGESEEIDSENSDIGSDFSSEGDDHGYASL